MLLNSEILALFSFSGSRILYLTVDRGVGRLLCDWGGVAVFYVLCIDDNNIIRLAIFTKKNTKKINDYEKQVLDRRLENVTLHTK